jgi:putative ABC transport system permease protein
MRALLSFRMAYRHVRAGFGRVALSVVSIALGVALVVAIQLMNAAVLSSFLETMDAVAGRAAFSVVAGDGLTFPEAIVEKVEKVSGVKLAVPLVSSFAFPDDGSGEMLTVFGVDLLNDAAVRVYHRGRSEIVKDTLAFLNREDSIVVGREFADRKGWAEGDVVRLVTPSGARQFTVHSLLDPEGIARTLRGRLVVMDLVAAEAAFTAPGQISQIDVLVDPGREAEVLRAVAAVLPAGLRVEEASSQKEVVRRGIEGFHGMLTAFSLLAVVAGFVICYSRLGAIYEARTWEIGLQRAVGLRRMAVFWELLKESLLLGSVGVALGLPLGILIGRFGFSFVARTTALQFRMPEPSAHPALTLGAVLLGCAVGLAAAIIAALVPAMRLARTRPVTALTFRGRELPVETARWRAVPVLALLAGVATTGALYLATGAEFLGSLTTLLATVLVCAVPAPLLRGSAGAIASVWRTLLGPVGTLAASTLRQNPRRAALTVATLAVGLGVVLLFAILGQSLERTLIEQLALGFRADLVVTSPFVSGGYVTAPLGEEVTRRVAEIEGVANAAGYQRRDINFGEGGAILYGYDDAFFTDGKLREWPLEPGALPDALDRVRDGTGVLLTISLAHREGIHEGDSLRLGSPNGLRSYVVTGITRSDPSPVIILSRAEYKRGWNDDKITWAFVSLDDPADAPAVEARIAKEVGESFRIRVQTSDELIQYFAGQVREAFRLAYVMDAIILLLVTIGIGDTLATTVLDRGREFAMMRAVGLHRVHILLQVILEGVALAVLGMVLAAILGVAIGAFWVAELFPAMTGWLPEFHFPYGFVVTTFAITLLLCLMSSAAPAIRAARMPVAIALRND